MVLAEILFEMIINLFDSLTLLNKIVMGATIGKDRIFFVYVTD